MENSKAIGSDKIDMNRFVVGLAVPLAESQEHMHWDDA